MSSGATPATTALRRAGIEFTLHRYEHDKSNAAYGTEAVEKLADPVGMSPAQILKTLVISLDGGLAVAVLPVPSTLSLKAAAAALGGSKATMADKGRAQRTTGYVLGGVSPLGQRRRLRTVVDESVLDHQRVLCSSGRRGLEVELSPGDLVRATAAVTATITA